MDEYTAPHWRHSALLTVDVQRDFSLPGAVAYVPGTEEIIAAIGRLVGAYRTEALPVVHIVRLYLPDGENADLCRREGIRGGARIVAPGTDGAELIEDLKPHALVRMDPDLLLRGQAQQIADNEWMLYKPRWGGFYKTGLEDHLRSRGVDTVLVCGCNFPNCPRTTIYEASERDFRIVVAADAVSGLYDRGMRELEGIGAVLSGVDECLEWLSRSRALRS